MTQSMTGYGSASDDAVSVEIRSLNHRFIDISIKMPPFMNHHEIPLRNILKEKFERGRFDVLITVNAQRQPRVVCNVPLAKRLIAALEDLKRELSLPGTITIEMLSHYRDMLFEAEPTVDTGSLYDVFRTAVHNLNEMRTREGNLLSAEIRARLDVLKKLIQTIRKNAPDELARWRDKFTARLRLIVDADTVDSSRILQEAALMAEKLDISEETSRIENHLHQMGVVLDSDDAAGKKLDFLLQELNREVNTLACKSGEYAISTIVVEMKTEIEKIREQVQNMQ